jgi:hypothetical protein
MKTFLDKFNKLQDNKYKPLLKKNKEKNYLINDQVLFFLGCLKMLVKLPRYRKI